MTESRGTDQGERKAGLGFKHLSMNEVPPSARVATEEAPRQRSRAGLWVVLVLVAVAVVAFGFRMISSVAPSSDAQAKLQRAIEELPGGYWQKGVILQAQYLSGKTVRLEFSSRLNTADDANREVIRRAAREVFGALRKERPNSDLFIDGFQEGEQIVRGEYRYKSSLVGPGGEQVPDMTIRVKGDPEGGMGGAYGKSAGQRR
ncbi:MAG: hypothetical protein ACE149_14645 [Armatimonadota bacterium]